MLLIFRYYSVNFIIKFIKTDFLNCIKMEQQTRIISFSSFPIKLHSILSNPRLSHIISWLPHGRSWRINNHKEFEQKIIPRYFRHRNLSSFMRQVNGWGFHRITAGLDRNSYYLEVRTNTRINFMTQVKL